MVKKIEAVARALSVLEALDAGRACSLAELHHATGIARATLLRILATLIERRWVRRGMGDGLYRLTADLSLRASPAPEDELLAQRAAPIMRALRETVGWPSDVAVRDGVTMRLIETSREHGGLVVNYRTVGFRPHMLWSALGRAYLAFCGEAERQELLDGIRAQGREDDRVAANRTWVSRLVSETRDRGYGVREPGYWGHAVEGAADDLDAIAVPVMDGGKIVACLNMVWLREAVPTADMAARHLGELRAAALRMVEAVRR